MWHLELAGCFALRCSRRREWLQDSRAPSPQGAKPSCWAPEGEHPLQHWTHDQGPWNIEPAFSSRISPHIMFNYVLCRWHCRVEASPWKVLPAPSLKSGAFGNLRLRHQILLFESCSAVARRQIPLTAQLCVPCLRYYTSLSSFTRTS